MRSLRARVALAAAASGAIVFLACGFAVVSALSAAKVQTLDRRLERAADRAIEDVFRSSVHGFMPATLAALGMHGRVYSQRTGRVIDETGGLPPGIAPGPEGFSFQTVAGRRWRVYGEESSVGNPRWGHPFVLIAVPTAEVDAEIARVRYAVAGSGVLATLLLGALVWWLAGFALAPLARLQEGAREIAAGDDLSRRLPIEGVPELAGTATALNRTLDRIQRDYRDARAALDATRTFTADAGHELRTPLTSLWANLDVLARDDLDPADRERALRDSLSAHARLTALIDGLQTLARGDAAAVTARSGTVDVTELADAAVIDARRRHPGVTFRLEAGAAAPVAGDPDGLRMMLDNLLENAAVHGGRNVRVHVRRGDGYALLSVDDDGPGIPDVDKGRVFERFARGSAARNGTGSGLGLAIAAQQAELHGSRLKLDDSPLGGARFELVLSARASS